MTKESPACHWFPSDDSGVWWEKPIFSLVKCQLFSQSQVFSRKWMEIDHPSGKPASAAPCHHGSSTGEAAAALPCSLSSSSGICELQAGTSTSSMSHVFGQRMTNAPCPAVITWVLLRGLGLGWVRCEALIICQIRIQTSLLAA